MIRFLNNEGATLLSQHACIKFITRKVVTRLHLASGFHSPIKHAIVNPMAGPIIVGVQGFGEFYRG